MNNRWFVFAVVGALGLLAILFLGVRRHATGDRSASLSAEASNANHSSRTTEAGADFEKGAREALAESDPRKRSLTFGELLTRWFDADAEGAITFVKTLGHGQDLAEALLIVLPKLAASDPDR